MENEPSKSLEKANSVNEQSSLLVQWDGDDRENIRLISKPRKWLYTMILVCATFQLTMLSSVWSTANDSVQEHFGASHEVSVLGVALFVLGFGLCPPFVLAPLSELYGRRPLYICASVCYVAFQFMTAFGPNIACMVVGRFLTALGGSIYLSNTPGSISDMFYKHEQAVPMNIYPVGAFIGPTIGPLVGGFLDYYCGFRWVFYAFLIMSAVMSTLVIAFLPETYEPVLLAKKAKRIREETGNDDFYAPFDKQQKGFISAVKNNCSRPIKLFILDPMMTLLCIYTGFLMAIVYFFFICFPIVFKETYGFKIYHVGLAFLGLTVGMGIATACGPLWRRLYAKMVAKNAGISQPEMRLPQMCIGGLLVPVGLFMFGWTLYPTVHWIVPIIASGIFGLGCNWTFTGIMNYTAEAYREYAASAMAANVLLRGVMSFSFPLFGSQLLYGLGFHWGVSLLAFVSLGLAPSAFVLYRFGSALRSRSRFASNS